MCFYLSLQRPKERSEKHGTMSATTMNGELDDVMKDYEKQGLLHEMFEAQARATPDKVGHLPDSFHLELHRVVIWRHFAGNMNGQCSCDSHSFWSKCFMPEMTIPVHMTKFPFTKFVLIFCGALRTELSCS